MFWRYRYHLLGIQRIISLQTSYLLVRWYRVINERLSRMNVLKNYCYECWVQLFQCVPARVDRRFGQINSNHLSTMKNWAFEGLYFQGNTEITLYLNSVLENKKRWSFPSCKKLGYFEYESCWTELNHGELISWYGQMLHIVPW